MKEKQIGRNLKHLREMRNLTQEYVAKKLNIGATTYGGMERGEISRITLDRWEKLAEVLDVHLLEIVGDRSEGSATRYPTADIKELTEHFRRDKQLLFEMLKTHKELYTLQEKVVRENSQALEKICQLLMDCRFQPAAKTT